eukprot:GFUD01038196.1.p1 GENE.GFUD01038196.1~~GFUD01038196.1.p1  ORF type:complete len:181 (-),score=0.04 GFUD01038196.1:237-779(-)
MLSVTCILLLCVVAPPLVSAVRDHQNILDWINYYRSLHGARALKWDDNLQYKAYEATTFLCSRAGAGRSLSLTHDGNEATSLYGSTGSNSNAEVDAVKSWYSESSKYCSLGYYNNPQNVDYQITGHFTDLVWKGNRKVGTWTSTCGKNTYVAILTGNSQGNVVRNTVGAYGKNIGRPADC